MPTRGSVVLVALLMAGTAGAQSEPPAQYAEEIEVRVIDVDVVVTDRQGNRLTNLTREDFELYEDGRRVDIAYFSRTAGGRIADIPPPADGVAAAPQPRIPLTWVVFIDHTNLAPQARNQAMRQLQAFLQRAITRGDRGVIALNDGRSFRIRQGVTDDPKLLMETLAKMQKERMSVSPTRSRANSVFSQMRQSEGGSDSAGGGRLEVRDETLFMAQTAGNEIAAVIAEEASRTRSAITAMSTLLDALAEVDGRLALVYVGAGFNTLPAADLTATWRSRYAELGPVPFEPRPEDVKEPIEREITRLYNNLSALRVTVYTIHGGEQAGGPTSVEDAGSLDTELANSTGIGQLTEAGHARELAQRTGGLFFKVNQNLAGQLDVVVRDLDDYYSLGYKPDGTPNDTRRIKVKVNVDGARVRHREAVRERTRTEKAAGTVVAAMVRPQPRVARKLSLLPSVVPAAVATDANPLGVSIQADSPRRQGWEDVHHLTFDFSINLEALTFARGNNGYRADFVMHFALVGEDGAVYPLESREQALTLPPAEMARASGSLVSYAWHVDVAPLRISEDIPAKQKGLRLTVTVEDRNSGTRSVVTVPLGKELGTRG